MIVEKKDLKMIRERLGWTKSEMATVLGTSISEVSDLEHGRVEANPELERVIEELSYYSLPKSRR